MTPSFLRDTTLVARFEIAEAVRSKLLLVMLLLFLGAGSLGAWGFTKAVQRIEQEASSVVPGVSVKIDRSSPLYRNLIQRFVHDPAKAEYFLSLPPIVFFYAWASLGFMPWLVLFLSAETIASEVSSRGIRYSLLRTGRLPYALGKMAGQAVILAGAAAAAALAYYAVSWKLLGGVEAGGIARGMLCYWPLILLHNLPFLAWALFASMATASANLSRILSLGGAVVLAILSALSGWSFLQRGPVSAGLWKLASFLTPFGHAGGLEYPRGTPFWTDAATCLGLSLLYFGAGYALLRRRDV